MDRLTFDTGILSFCEVAKCGEVRGGIFCKDGYCDQRRAWERLKAYEDAEEQGRIAAVAHGRWVKGAIGLDCSVCGEYLCGSDEYDVNRNYCPSCGARMDLEERDG